MGFTISQGGGGAAGGGLTGGTEEVIVKAADESVNNSTTMQNDDDFSFSVAANTKYLVEMFIIVDGPTAQAFEWDWTVPSGATGWHAGLRALNFAGNAFQDSADYTFSTQLGISVNGAGSPISALLTAYIDVDSTAGTVQWRWAQQVAAAVNTTVKAGSWMRVITLD